MISLLLTNQKAFSSMLFSQEVFDNFILTEAEFVTSFRTEIQGAAGSGNDSEPVSWSTIRPVAYRILQGNQLPRRFHIVMKLSDESTRNTVHSFGLGTDMDEMPALFINIIYDREKMRIVTGCSRRTFTLDRSLDDAWDAVVRKFLRSRQVDFEDEAQA